jgi:tetratricopeptide (TPR) repeat protein
LAGWIAIFCLSVSPANAQSDAPGSVRASSLADSLYRDGLAALERADWAYAVVSFEKLQSVAADYHDAGSHRARAWEKLNQQRKAENGRLQNGRGKTIFYAGLAGFALLVVSGFAGASPNTRARFRVWRGDYHGATRVYEKILQRHPHRAKFYLPLGDIYLRLGRNDDRAIRVYKAILHLNPAAPNRKEINRMVAQKYLTGDFTDDEAIMDDDAIPVLEEALKAERHQMAQKLALC